MKNKTNKKNYSKPKIKTLELRYKENLLGYSGELGLSESSKDYFV